MWPARHRGSNDESDVFQWGGSIRRIFLEDWGGGCRSIGVGRRVGWRCVRRKVGWFEVLDGNDMSTGAHLQENGMGERWRTLHGPW